MDLRTRQKAVEQVDKDLSTADIRKFMKGLADGTYAIVTEEDRLRYDTAQKRLAREGRNEQVETAPRRRT